MRRFIVLTCPLLLAAVTLAIAFMPKGSTQEPAQAEPDPAPVQVRDLAELFPARTAAYLETKDIKASAKEIKAILKGSFLEDMPGSMEKIMPRERDFYRGYEFMMMGIYFGPEVLEEAGRLKGGAIAILDTPKDYRQPPNYLGVLLAGDSNLVHLLVRSSLSFGQMRTVATVENVRIYRESWRGMAKPAAPQFKDNFKDAPKPKFDDKEPFQVQVADKWEDVEHPHSPAIAMMPGAIVIGSKNKEVGDLIRRLKGKDVGANLASLDEFKKHADLRKDPGLFAFANFETVLGLGHEMFAPRRYETKKKDGVREDFKDKAPPFKDKDFDLEEKKLDKFEQVNAQQPGGFGGGRQHDAWADLHASLGASFSTLAAGLSLKDGTVDLRGSLRMDQNGKSAWPEFFTSRALNFELLNYVPGDSRFALAVAMPQGMKFWDKLGKTAPVLETDLAALLALVDIEKIVQVGIVYRSSAGARIAHDEYQFIVETKDEETAKALASAPLKNKFNIASKGRFAAFGQDRKSLEELLNAGAAGKGLLSQPKVAKAVKAHEGAHALLVWSWGQSLADSAQAEIRWLKEGFREEKRIRELQDKQRELFDKDKKDGEVAFAQPGEPIDPNQPGDQLKRLERIAKDFNKAVEDLPPFVLSVTRKDDQLLIAGKQTNLQGTLARVLNLMVESQMSRMDGGRGPRFDRHFDGPAFQDFDVPTEKAIPRDK